MQIAIQNVSKRFSTFAALDDVSLDIQSGELIALLGPSGSGKTTLLRIIAGLEWPDEGAVLFDGADALARTVGERHVGFVFQHYALFRHLSIFENVAFGLRAQPRRIRLAEDAIRARVNELLELVQLGSYGKRYPHQLSGGQRQRVALARALATRPTVLLLDEPFGALDAKVRKELRHWLRDLHDEIKVTSVFVTHDQEEALEVADRVVVLGRGRIEQTGTPGDVYERPATAFVQEFIGDANRLPVTIVDGVVRFGEHALSIERQDVRDGDALLFVRPQDFTLADAASDAALRGRVTRRLGFGHNQRIEIAVTHAGKDVRLEVGGRHSNLPAVGAEIAVRPESYRLFSV